MQPSVDVNRAYLVMLNLPMDEPSALIEERPKVVGRSADADIGIPARFRSASRRHAEVWRDERGLWIRDLGSAVGTSVNRLWIAKMRPVPLMVGDQLWMGQAYFEIVGGTRSCSGVGDDDEAHAACRKTTLLPVEPLPSRFTLEHLTEAESEVVLWLSRGFTKDEEIGEKLHRSPHTVRTHVANIFEKLGLHSRTELIGYLQRFTG